MNETKTEEKKGEDSEKLKCCGCPAGKELIYCGCACHKEKTWHGRGTNRVLYNGLMSGDEIKKGDIL